MVDSRVCRIKRELIFTPNGGSNKKYTPEFKKLVAETMQNETLGYCEPAQRFGVRRASLTLSIAAYIDFHPPCRCILHMQGGLLLPQRLIFQCPFSSSRQFFAVVLTAGAHRLGLAVEHHLDGLHTPAAEMQTAPSLLCCRRLGAVLAGAWQTRKQSFIRSSPKPRSQQGYFQGVRSCQRQSEWADQSHRQILPEGAR